MNSPNRRTVLAGIATVAAVQTVSAQAKDSGLVPDLGSDQSDAFRTALDHAATTGQTLRLPAGEIIVGNIEFPGNLAIEGVPGRTVLTPLQGATIGRVGTSGLVLRDIAFVAKPDGNKEAPALLGIEACEDITLERCQFSKSSMGLSISDAAVTIRDCRFTGLGDVGIHSINSRGLLITSSQFDACGNAGIRIWRSEPGPDGSIVTENRISNIDWVGGGNGQNGNGINIFRADEVIISDNHISNCAFSAIRLNTTNNTQVSGNLCLNSGETGIFSEFAFSGSVIANNIVDGAAGGISMTNLDNGGHLAVCSGNIVRNIVPKSRTNPDSSPYGIAAQAEVAVTGNTISRVPGPAISIGYGPFLRNVLVSGNVMHEVFIGIAVSVAPGVGSAQVTGNLIDGAERGIVGMAWEDMIEPDLIASAANYPLFTIANNTIGPNKSL